MHLVRLWLLALAACAGTAGGASGAELARRTWTIDGTVREALVHVPAASGTPAPVLFFFHGRSGKVAEVAARHPFHTYWPEAIVVFPQGLPVAALRGDGGNLQPGWQVAPGQHDDRDLRFFDTLLASLRRELRVDDRRVYVSGTSNGGGMTYLLWSQRASVFAAIAPTCTAARALTATASADAIRRLAPLPSLHVAGEKDATIPFADQLQTIDLVREGRACGPGVPWGSPPQRYATLHPSSSGAPLVTYVYPGGHGLPSDVTPVIVKFFREHRRP